MKHEIFNELNLVKDHERECKLATGGLPESIKLKNSIVVTLNKRATTK